MKVTIGIDLGGMNIKGVLVDEHGEILLQHSIATNDAPDGTWKENILAMVRYLKSACNEPVELIGLSCPGLANESNTCITHMPGRLAGLEHFIWEDYLGTKTYVINDAHAALMAETQLGVLQGYKNAVLLTLGTGVGGAILINGELYQGLNQMAGHFGHTTLNVNDDELSILGMPGSLEYALGNYSAKRRSMGRFESTLEIVNAYLNNDPFSTWLWLDSVRKLAITIASLANSLSIEIVVLAGGITKAGDALFKPLKAFMDVYEFRPYGNTKTIVAQAKFSDLSGAIGAAVFANKKNS
ncbi:MAG TPA: ROK family protein [Mucilaginibacter sp.]|jgi:glucokinase|nr:ROK family protein [Mucilaginibacter sp.]